MKGQQKNGGNGAPATECLDKSMLDLQDRLESVKEESDKVRGILGMVLATGDPDRADGLEPVDVFAFLEVLSDRQEEIDRLLQGVLEEIGAARANGAAQRQTGKRKRNRRLAAA